VDEEEDEEEDVMMDDEEEVMTPSPAKQPARHPGTEMFAPLLFIAIQHLSFC
jgi:hypothetical protein